MKKKQLPRLFSWQKSPNVDEVIMVDDKSMDNTVDEARRAGATIITSTKLGKGASMKDGVLVAKNTVIAFLDADIITYQSNVIELLTAPIISGETDFLKSYFARQAGRVPNWLQNHYFPFSTHLFLFSDNH